MLKVVTKNKPKCSKMFMSIGLYTFSCFVFHSFLRLFRWAHFSPPLRKRVWMQRPECLPLLLSIFFLSYVWVWACCECGYLCNMGMWRSVFFYGFMDQSWIDKSHFNGPSIYFIDKVLTEPETCQFSSLVGQQASGIKLHPPPAPGLKSTALDPTFCFSRQGFFV